jgi:hypothetical protein
MINNQKLKFIAYPEFKKDYSAVQKGVSGNTVANCT